MKPIVVFAVLGAMLGVNKVGDVLNIPPSKLSYAKVINKEHTRIRYMDLYKVCFELDRAKVLDLTVPRRTYHSVSEGSRGVLVHTETRFRKFHVDKKIPDIIKPKKKSNNKNKRGYK